MRRQRPPCLVAGVNITLAEVVVAISGFVVREHCVLSPAWEACYRTCQGGNCLPWKIQFSAAVAKRPPHPRPGECVVWTHPESLLQVALINHADIALTLLYLSWQNPVLPAPQTLMWYQERWSKVLVVAGVVIPLSSLCCLELLAVTLVDWMTFLPGVEDLGPIFQWTEAQFPGGLPAEISGLEVSSFYRLLATE